MQVLLPPPGTLMTVDSVNEYVDKAQPYKYLSFDTETDVLHGNVIGLSMTYGADHFCYIPLINDREEKLEILRPLFTEGQRTLIGHNIKYDMHALFRSGISVTMPIWDTFVAAWLLDENRLLDLKTLTHDQFGVKMTELEELMGTGRKKLKSLLDVPLAQISSYSMADAHYTYQLFLHYDKKLNDEGLVSNFNILMNVTRVLYKMEQRGIRVDTGQLSLLSQQMQTEIKASERKIWVEAGTQFDIGSPKQLGNILFKKMGLSPLKFSPKTQVPSVDEETLETLQDKSKIVELIMDYRELTKLKSTYTDGFVPFLDKNNRIHTNFKIGGAITGRLSSSKPNLQNIPVRSPRGKLIRNCFIARDGFKLIVADYHNIELRLLAHFSKDSIMCDAYANNKNLHIRTAIDILGAPPDNVTAEYKARAKTINFGLMYGMGPKALMKKLKCDYTEARIIYERYFQVYSGIVPWKYRVIDFCRQKGYILTLTGRKRHIPDINSSDNEKRSRAERQAVNSKIQGSCSDIIFIAMCNIEKQETDGFYQLVQVHDELVFESDNDVRDIPIITKCMEMQVLRVPVVVEVAAVNRWGDAK
jgi:DNA polymerase-1